MYLDGQFGRTARSEGKDYLFFSGYDYLSVRSNPDFCKLIEDGIKKFGWIYPSSRISNTQTLLYENCEQQLSKITRTDATVLFGSGYNAGQACLSLFKDEIDNAPFSHPSILQTKPVVEDFELWKNQIINNQNAIAPIVASDSIDNFSLCKFDFSDITRSGKSLTCIFDDSHGIGVTGPTGGGISEYLVRNPAQEYLFTYSLGKAFGIVGGAVSTSTNIAQKLRKHPSYTAVTPPSPAPLYAFLNGQEIYALQLEKLRQNIQYSYSLFQNIPDTFMHLELPIVLLPSTINENDFLNAGFIISSFAYPNPSGKKLNRLVLNAAHTFSDIEKVAAFTQKCLNKI